MNAEMLRKRQVCFTAFCTICKSYSSKAVYIAEVPRRRETTNEFKRIISTKKIFRGKKIL